jgi:para-aminobenzoate synthetase / 4-amino-4-deoxychorismate lyase
VDSGGLAVTGAGERGAGAEVWARFDDLGPGGTSFVLSGLSAELVGESPSEVAGVLQAAEQAAREGNWVAGFATYEAAPGLDSSLPSADWPAGHPLTSLPLVWFGVFEHREEVPPPVPVPPAAAGGALAGDAGAASSGGSGGEPVWDLDRDRAWHARAVAEIQENIAAGDYYQLNLTARLTGSVSDPEGLYGLLATAQGGRHNALIVTPQHTVISASPELFFTAESGRVTTRPMKGTAPRGRWPGEDLRSREALRTSPKERAENVMIVDLLRNDLGRIAEVGTVEVPALFDTERYPTLWQLTSTIAARTPPEIDLAATFAALFPSGSVTGAPKRAAMQAIARIEERPRGVYCGAIGYLRPRPDRPDARFAVAIRTITRDNRSGYAEYGSGGAITFSSDPAFEWAELLTKTAVLRPPPRPERLLETLRFEPPASLVNRSRHLERLASSAAYFGFDLDLEALDRAFAAGLESREVPSRVRIVLEASGEVRVEVTDLPASGGVVSLGLADRPVRSDDVLLFHKHGDRARYDRFREAGGDVDDVVLWNERREVTETTIANLAVQLDGRWWTPPLSSGLLPGVERGRLIEAGDLTERVILTDEVLTASALAVVNSLRGWRPAKLRI